MTSNGGKEYFDWNLLVTELVHSATFSPLAFRRTTFSRAEACVVLITFEIRNLVLRLNCKLEKFNY